jgi:type IV pilus assembly protein PilW
MVAIAIGLLILAAMALIFANASATRAELDRTNRQIENGRYAMELLRDDIQLAGFYSGVNATALTDPASIPDPCATTLTERTTGGGDTGVLKLHVQGINDYTAGTLGCLTGANLVKPGTDVIVIRRAKTCVAGAADCDAFVADDRPYLQISLCNTTTATHTLAKGSDTFALQLKDCATASPRRPYVIYLYFVGTDNVLKRAEFTGTAMANVTPLVEGIENLQFDYGIDSSGNDGAADSYTGNPATIANWMNVVTVRIHLLARNPDVSPAYSDTKTYELGTGGTVGPFNDAYRRHVYSSLVRIVNVSAKRETP